MSRRSPVFGVTALVAELLLGLLFADRPELRWFGQVLESSLGARLFLAPLFPLVPAVLALVRQEPYPIVPIAAIMLGMLEAMVLVIGAVVAG